MGQEMVEPRWLASEGGMGCGNCRTVETVEKRTACFSTVPTALGKLGKLQLRRVFHSYHSPYYYPLSTRANPEAEGIPMIGLDQIRMDKTRPAA